MKCSVQFAKLFFLLSLFASDLITLYSTLFKWEKHFDVTVINHSILLIFPLEIVLLFTGRRRSCTGPDRTLQEALRTRLRVVESNSQDVIQLFKVSNNQNWWLGHFRDVTVNNNKVHYDMITIHMMHCEMLHCLYNVRVMMILDGCCVIDDMSLCFHRTCLHVWCLSMRRRTALCSLSRLWKKSGSFQHT